MYIFGFQSSNLLIILQSNIILYYSQIQYFYCGWVDDLKIPNTHLVHPYPSVPSCLQSQSFDYAIQVGDFQICLFLAPLSSTAQFLNSNSCWVFAYSFSLVSPTQFVKKLNFSSLSSYSLLQCCSRLLKTPSQFSITQIKSHQSYLLLFPLPFSSTLLSSASFYAHSALFSLS